MAGTNGIISNHTKSDPKPEPLFVWLIIGYSPSMIH